MFAIVGGAAACGRSQPEVCTVAPAGTLVWIDDDNAAYSDIVSLVRAERFDELIQSAPRLNGSIRRSGHSEPAICKTDQPIPKSMTIAYGWRRQGDVGAVVDLHLDQHDRVKVAEFYVVPLAP